MNYTGGLSLGDILLSVLELTKFTQKHTPGQPMLQGPEDP